MWNCTPLSVLAITSPGLPRRMHRARAEREALTAPGREGAVVRQHNHCRHSPQSLLPDSHHLDAAGQLLLLHVLDREGHISAQPHYVPREQALILAANHCGCSVPKARCGCSELPGQEALRLRLSVVATPPVGLGFLEQWITSLPGKRVDALIPSPKRLTAAD